MATKYRTSDPRMFTVPATDNLRDALIGSEVHCETRLRMTAQRGVFEFQTALYDNLKGDQSQRVAAVTESYPNARAESWEAFWFAHTNKVARMAEEYRSDQNRVKAAQVVGRG